MGAPRPIREIFADAVELAGAERAAFLDRECGADAALRGRVEHLLTVFIQGKDFLVSPTSGATATGLLQEKPGTRVGPYKLLQQIGEGGFGVVFLAEQERPINRRVALKIIKLGMDTRAVIARFEAERQALALMDHPNIARVFDAGATETGRPYFVMELVKGEPITEYCDRHSLALDERLALFQDVCHAVQHAHQKGIIHRDLKPANVLVTTADGRPTPKVIDFGIAKATSARLTEKTLFTEHRALIGTPEYMSPEQAETTAADVDTRSDIYSLGVLLYELLTGSTPFDPKRLRSAAFGEIQRIIREEEPAKPSTRLSTLVSLPGIAAQRQSDPRRLSALVRGDLDWIVMKCLEKEPARRYETANGLAADLQRHARNEPVMAGPPGGMYRLRTFARRHRVAVLAGSMIAALLVLGVIGTSAGMVWALGERRRAEEARRGEAAQRQVAEESESRALANEAQARAEATRASTALDLLNELLAPPPQQGPAVGPPPADSESDDSSKGFPKRLGAFSRAWGLHVHEDPGVESEVRMILGRTLRREASNTQAAGQFERAYRLRRRLRGEIDPDTGEALVAWVEALAFSGDRKGAIRVARDAVDAARAHDKPDDREVAERLHALADALNWDGDFAGAEAPAHESLDLRVRAGGPPTTRLGDILSLLGDLTGRRREWDSAEDFYVRSAEAYRGLKGEFDPGTIRAERRLAGVLAGRGDYARMAEVDRDFVDRARRAMTPGQPTADERAELALRLAYLSNAMTCVPGGVPEAERAAREELEVRRGLGDRDPSWVVRAGGRLGIILWMQARYAEAERVLRASLNVPETGEDAAEVVAWKASSAGNLSVVIRDGGGDLAEAESFVRRAIDGNPNPPSHWTFWLLDGQLAVLCRLQGRDGEALVLERRAVAIGSGGVAKSLGGAMSIGFVGRSLDGFGQHATAEQFLVVQESIMREMFPETWERFDSASELGRCLAAQSKFAQAEPLILQSAERLPAMNEAPRDRATHALSRAVSLYEAWNAAVPGKGYDAKAQEWRARLDAASPPAPGR